MYIISSFCSYKSYRDLKSEAINNYFLVDRINSVADSALSEYY